MSLGDAGAVASDTGCPHSPQNRSFDPISAAQLAQFI